MRRIVDRAPQAFEPLRLVGPDEGLQDPRAVLGRDVDRAAVDAPPARHRERRGRAAPRAAARGRHRSSTSSDAPHVAGAVAVRVPVPDEVETRARAELEHVERPPVGHREERRQERVGALHLVRLHLLLGRMAPEEAAVRVERAVDVVPGRLACKHQIVEAAEQAQRQIPAQIGGDPVHAPVAGKPAAERRVER